MRNVIALGAAAALMASAAPAAGAPRTIAFTSVTSSQSRTRTGFRRVGTDFQGSVRVGRDRLGCVARQAVVTCADTVTRARGTIEFAFRLGGTDTSGPLTVVGGTGVYRGVTGRGTYDGVDAVGARSAITLRLAAPAAAPERGRA